MKNANRIIRMIDRAEDLVIMVFFVLMFLIGVYALYDTFLICQNAQDDTLQNFKPGYEQEASDSSGRPITDNMVAWITLEDTSIDYPIMQGKNNEEYLSMDPYGEFSLSGSIFLDYRNKQDFSDEYSLVYGHHMDQGYMFGALDEYAKSEEYFKTHKNGSLILNNEKATEYLLQVVAIVEGEATDAVLFSPAETAAAEILDYINRNSIYKEEDELAKYDSAKKMVALSTCKNANSTKRIIVICFILAEKTE